MNRDLAILEKLEKDLNLKKLQIKSLLTITQAINDNVSSDGLYNMYKSFLSWEMNISKMALFVVDENGWQCKATFNYELTSINTIIPLIIKHKRLYTIKENENNALNEFDIVIPVFHKNYPIAYSLIGGIRDKEDLYNKIQFITTITNIIAVAIENKRLFRKQIEQEKYKHEMELAGEVQQMLIPHTLPKEEKYELSKIYMPHSNIGGDYLDFIRFDKNKFAMCIADISGKGVAAALLMANFQAITHSLIYQYRDLETFLFALNQSVYKITNSDKFITFFIAEIDIKKRQLKYINAGHYPPVLVNDGKITRLDKGSTIIGAFQKLPEIQEECINIENEALILSFTDGLAELKDANGNYFDDQCIEQFVSKHFKKNAKDINKALLNEIEDFKQSEKYTDDIAVLTCKIFN